MKLLDEAKKVDMSFGESMAKLALVFLVCIPLPMVGLAFAGYGIASAFGFSHGLIAGGAILLGSTLGAFVGFVATLGIIKVGH